MKPVSTPYQSQISTVDEQSIYSFLLTLEAFFMICFQIFLLYSSSTSMIFSLIKWCCAVKKSSYSSLSRHLKYIYFLLLPNSLQNNVWCFSKSNSFSSALDLKSLIFCPMGSWIISYLFHCLCVCVCVCVCGTCWLPHFF